MELIYATEHANTVASLNQAAAERDRLVALMRRFAAITPHPGEWERGLRAFQQEARSCLASVHEGPAH